MLALEFLNSRDANCIAAVVSSRGSWRYHLRASTRRLDPHREGHTHHLKYHRFPAIHRVTSRHDPGRNNTMDHQLSHSPKTSADPTILSRPQVDFCRGGGDLRRSTRDRQGEHRRCHDGSGWTRDQGRDSNDNTYLCAINGSPQGPGCPPEGMEGQGCTTALVGEV